MEISSELLREKIKNGEKVIVDFHATWCGPCKMMKPIFEKVSNSNDTEVQMYTFNIDNNKEVAMSLGIRSIPTVKVFNAGEVVETKVGLMNEGQIKTMVTELING
jgi:thioredoxin 1